MSMAEEQDLQAKTLKQIIIIIIIIMFSLNVLVEP
jgi:hypothetical protein